MIIPESPEHGAVIALRRTDPIVNAVMCLGERDNLPWPEVLARMVVELARCNAARLDELTRVALRAVPMFISGRPTD